MPTNYRKGVFKHWANLAFVGAGSVFGAIAFGPLALLGVAIFEGAILWIAPDIKSVQRSLDNSMKNDTFETNRWWYLKQLWNIEKPMTDTFSSLLVKRPVNWVSVVSDSYGSDEDQQTFVRLCKIVDGLWDLREIRPDAISPDQLSRVDEMINGWLTFLYTAKNIQGQLEKLDKRTLQNEMARLEAMRSGPLDGASQVVLTERFRTLKAKVESLPQAQHQLGLVLAQAESLVQHIESISNQARTSGAVDVGSILDSAVMDKTLSPQGGGNEMMIQAEVRNMVSNTDTSSDMAWADLKKTLGDTAETPEAEEDPVLARNRLRGRRTTA